MGQDERLVQAHRQAASNAERRVVIPSAHVLRVLPSPTSTRCCGSTRAMMPRWRRSRTRVP